MDKNIMRIAELCEKKEPKDVYTELKLSSVNREVWIMGIIEDGEYYITEHFTRTEMNGETWWTNNSNKRVSEEDVIRALEEVRNA